MREPLKISVDRRLALWATWAILALSGGIWLLAKAWQGGDGQAEKAHVWQQWSMAVHGAAALLFLLVLGALWGHIKAALAQARNRWSGLLSLGSLVVMLVSSWWLYYGGADSRDLVALVHWGLGLLLCLGLPWHAWMGRHSRKGRSR